MVTELRTVLLMRREGMTKKWHKGTSWGDRNVLHPTEVCIILVYTSVKTDQTLHLRYVHFPVHKVYPNFK